jgi:hypothetical protein
VGVTKRYSNYHYSITTSPRHPFRYLQSLNKVRQSEQIIIFITSLRINVIMLCCIFISMLINVILSAAAHISGGIVGAL